MCGTMLVLSVLLFPAQNTGDATALLTAVVDAARTAKTWRVEGHVTVEDSRKGDSVAHDFKLVWRAPALARLESDGTVSAKTLVVCGETILWTYSPSANHYTTLERVGGADASDAIDRTWISKCSFPIGHWQNLLVRLASATFVGHDILELDGQSRGCENVRAEYGAGRGIRIMCIDPDRLLILREQVETNTPGRGDSPPVNRLKTTTYRAIERDVELGDGLFVFDPPAGSTATDLGAFKGEDVTRPVPIYRPDPAYPKKASRKKIEGTVILKIVVGPDGNAHDVRVVKSLDPDLDKSAVECVNTWRFQPGEKDGEPVSVMAQIEVNFRLRHDH